MKGLLCVTSFSQGNALQWTSNQKWLTQSFFLSRSPYSLCLTAHWKCLLVKSVWILDLLHKRIHQWWVCGYYQCLQTSLKLLSVLIPPPPLLITTPNCSSFTVHSSPLTSHFSLPSLTFHNPPLPLPHSSPLTSHSSLPSLTFHNSPLPLPISSLLTPTGVLPFLTFHNPPLAPPPLLTTHLPLFTTIPYFSQLTPPPPPLLTAHPCWRTSKCNRTSQVLNYVHLSLYKELLCNACTVQLIYWLEEGVAGW